MKVICSEKHGYRWAFGTNAYFRGYIQLSDATVLRGENAINYFTQATDFASFKKLLIAIDGCFSIIIKKQDRTFAAVDVARSMPLYYSSDGTVISDSSEAVRLVKCIDKENTEILRLFEMYATRYVAYENTVYSDIKQIELGCAAEFSDTGIKTEPYFIHISEPMSISRENAKQLLAELTDEMIDRLLKVIDGRPIVLSLSGGYDSRYIACSLKQHGVNNVICYTYGKKCSFEIQESNKVAEALGYEWHCVEYTDAKIKSILSDENKAYFEYCNEHDYTIYLQNYIAVKELKALGIIPDKAVFLTGLCNDMPTGSYFPSKGIIGNEKLCNRDVAMQLYKMRFIGRFGRFDAIREKLIIETERKLDYFGLKVTDYQSFVTAEDCLDTAGVHSKLYLNMNKPHEFFGYEWLLPCWDKSLLKFWYALPAEYRYKQNLYEGYVVDMLAARYGIGNKKQIAEQGKNKLVGMALMCIGGLFIRFGSSRGSLLRQRVDINNFICLETLFYKNISQKRAVLPERSGLMLLMSVWLMECRYGTKWYNKIRSWVNGA